MGGCLTRRLGVTPTAATIYDGILATRASDSTLSANAVLTFPTESYDRTNFHSTVSNTERITVPSTGLYQFTFNTQVNSPSPELVSSLGTDPPGSCMETSNGISAALMYTNMQSAIISLTAGDYETIVSASFGGTFKGGDFTTFNCTPISGSTKYCLVAKSANQSCASGTTTLTWDIENFDASGWHDNVTNNSRITPASGVTRVRLIAQINESAGHANSSQLQIIKNGGAFAGAGLPREVSDAGGTNVKRVNVVSAPIEITGNGSDYFEAQVTYSATVSVVGVATTGSPRCWFFAEEVPASVKYALLTNSSDTALSAGVDTTLTWDTEVQDANGLHSGSSSDIVCPSGCSQVRTGFSINGAPAANEFHAWVTKNGSTWPGMPAQSVNVSGADCVSGYSGWVDCSVGDAFACKVNSTTARNVDHTISWFCAEFR